MLRIATFAAAVAAAAIASGSAAAATPVVKGSVTDSFKITLTQGGKTIKTLKTGSYTIVVSDPTSSHDFHLKGPGVDRSTSVGGKGTFTWKLKLRAGTYTYVCDPHSSFMHGSFTVR